LVNVWFIEAPLLALAPVIEPVLVPKVHINVLAALAANVIFVLAPLQIVDVIEFVIAGVGFTVIVIKLVSDLHPLAVEVATVLKTILPALALLGLVKVWFIVEPLLALAPVIEPVLVPNVHAKVLDALAVNVIFGLAPLQIVAVFELVIVGLEITVIVAEPDCD